MLQWAIEKGIIGGILIVCLYEIAKISAGGGISTSIILSISPYILMLILAIASNPFAGLMVIFVLNYFIMGISRYLPIGYLGVSTDAMIVITLVSFMLKGAFKENIEWSKVKDNMLLKALLIWLAYCIIEIMNPTAVATAWLSAIRQYAIYPIFIVLFTTLLFNKFKHLKMILFLWSFFTLMAVAKVVMQMTYGFDSAELRWLAEGENARTHLLVTGIRYFSFFTDAGCFGANMGYAGAVFGIMALNVRKTSHKIYYLSVSAAAIFAMFISGTRGALAAPLVGFTLYTVCSKNFKSMIVVGTFSLLSVGFLGYTNIGQSNSYIARMRTAFDEDDASLVLRQQNRATLAVYMKNKPFGEGLGLSGGEGAAFAPGRLTTSIANDSWFVKIWVESGPVGVTLHVCLLAFFLIYGMYLILVKIRDKELRGLIAAILCGEAGFIVSAWGNPIFVQYPSGILNYMVQAFVFMSLTFDQEIADAKKLTENDESGKLV